jgi:very-short-patch-repair endonuclease
MTWTIGPRRQGPVKSARARDLRRDFTDAERLLWRHLRRSEIFGVRFRRQVPFGPYVLDFYCAKAKLAVELDGGQHFEDAGLRKDRQRDEFVASLGIKTLRYTDEEALRKIDDVLEDILRYVRAGRAESSPRPSPFQGEGGVKRGSLSI